MTLDNVELIPPHSQDAEEAVLGAMLLDSEAIAKVTDILRKEYFYFPQNQYIYEVITDLFEKSVPVDLVTVSDNLRSLGKLEEIGSYQYLLDLTNNLPTVANVEQYARIIEKKAILRQLIKVGTEITALGYESDNLDLSYILNIAEQKIFEIGQRRMTGQLEHIKTIVSAEFDRLEKAYEKQEVIQNEILSGFSDLDNSLGGLQSSDLIILAARPAMGKTSFALNIATSIAIKQKLPVAMFSLEMSKEQIAQRLICTEAGISSLHLRTGRLKDENYEIFTKAVAKLTEAPIYIDDSSMITPIEIRAKVRRLKSELKRIGIVIIDYLQLMEKGDSEENRVQELASITRSLKGMARELDVPVMALSQLNRGVEHRPNKRPFLSDLRESGSIEQDADIVMFIYRDEYYNPNTLDKNIAEIIIAKHRHGPTGKVKLFFDSDCTRFGNLAIDNG